jgi:hypothetical protein
MTQEEQQHVNAMRNFYEAQIANLAREGANAMMLAESFAIRLKAAEAERDALKPKDNVVQIDGAA